MVVVVVLSICVLAGLGLAARQAARLRRSVRGLPGAAGTLRRSVERGRGQ